MGRWRSFSIAGVRLTFRGQAFLASALVAFVLAYSSSNRELLYVGSLLAALPIIAIAWVRIRRPRLSVVRSFAPHVIPAGTAASVVLSVKNMALNRSAKVAWRDSLPWGTGETEESMLPTLAARGERSSRANTVSVEYELHPPRRGIYPIGPMHIQLVDAFGLATSSIVIGDPQPVTVTPEVIPLAETGLSVSAGDGEARLVQRRATGDDDDSMTREYRSGDAMRRVHWRASARHGDLMVRQEEQRSFPEARVIVDTRRAGYRDVSGDADDAGESESFEWVVRMLASVVVHLRRMGFLVTIEETGHAQLDLVAGGRRRSWGDEEFLVNLASISLIDTMADGHEPGIGDRERGSNGPIIALVGSPEPETVEWMLRQRRPGELAVAFMVQSPSAIDMITRSFGIASSAASFSERLSDAGWLVVPVRADDDHAAVWAAIVAETGRSRVDA